MKNYTLKDVGHQFTDGLFAKNPVFVQMLGMCSTLAITTSVINALGMGLAVTAVLICSNVFISLLRNFIPKQIRIASYIVIISGFVTAIQLLIKAYLPSLDKSLGLFIPLIVVNCIILARAESFASKNPVLPSAVDGIAVGVGFTFALTVLAAVREILGAGTLFGFQITPSFYEPAIIFILPSGAFLTLGMLIALMNKIMIVRNERARIKALAAAGLAIEPAPEVHLTEEEILVPMPKDEDADEASEEKKNEEASEAKEDAPAEAVAEIDAKQAQNAETNSEEKGEA